MDFQVFLNQIYEVNENLEISLEIQRILVFEMSFLTSEGVLEWRKYGMARSISFQIWNVDRALFRKDENQFSDIFYPHQFHP